MDVEGLIEDLIKMAHHATDARKYDGDQNLEYY